MDKPSHNLFEVYLRLRPASSGTTTDRILTVEVPEDGASHPSHITLNPPSDRRRAIEKFAFTRVFEEDASQLHVFEHADIAALVGGVIGARGDGTDAIVATLGVTGSGKTHTILGSRTQRGLTQLALDVLFRSVGSNLLEASGLSVALDSLQGCDASEAALSSASYFFEHSHGDYFGSSRGNSRAATPMMTGDNGVTSPQSRRTLQHLSTLPQWPDVSSITLPCDKSAEYAILVSMYEVHNDRIYDLLTTPSSKSAGAKDHRRRPLLFKSTELSPDRKVVAGLRKVACTSLAEAIMVVEAGLVQRRVAGTGSNSVSSRSHGFFCFEVKKRTRGSRPGPWSGSKLTIVDLAGSERAREAKTQGATLAEAGKINESLMYLGQCLQTQSEAGNSTKPNVIPFRQCKLTELLFSNSFPSSSAATITPRRNPQRGIMIVTADARGDFNATSQILRYSALAREVTVPRIPSITTTIMSNSTAPTTGYQSHSRPAANQGAPRSRSQTPLQRAEDRATMEIAALEIARMSDEMDQLRRELEAETEARFEAEAHLSSMEERMLDMEMAVRDECATEFEARLELELARFKASLAHEQERNDEHWDRKIDVLERGLSSAKGCRDNVDLEGDKENVLVEDMAQELDRLRRENAVLLRELAGRSPCKRGPLVEREDFKLEQQQQQQQVSGSAVMNLSHTFERMRMQSSLGGDA